MHCRPYSIRLVRAVSSFLKSANHKATAEICGKQINGGADLGLEIPVIKNIYGARKYMDRRDELIHGNKTAKGTLGQEDEGISIDGQKMKRKSAKKPKIRKTRLDMKANISRCCVVYAVTIERTVKL